MTAKYGLATASEAAFSKAGSSRSRRLRVGPQKLMWENNKISSHCVHLRIAQVMFDLKDVSYIHLYVYLKFCTFPIRKL